MMRKVGILTFHRAHNYGAVLQVYALQQFIKANSCEVEIVNYDSDVFRQYSLLNFFKRKNPIKMAAIILCKIRSAYTRHKAFENFIKDKLLQSKLVVKNIYDIETAQYDLYVIGSDQVWSLQIGFGFDPIYWGVFKTENNASKISYAASSETYPYPAKFDGQIKEALKCFLKISVREDNFANYLDEYTNKKIEVVLDPTLLVDRKIFDEIAIPPKKSSKYVLVYQVANDPEVLKVAEDVAKQINAEVIELKGRLSGRPKSKGCVETASPQEFIGFFKNASCIITTSFHGTAFSIIFEKEFYFVSLSNYSNRSVSLLEKLCLDERVIKTDSKVLYEKVNYSVARLVLGKEKNKSEKFIISALNAKGSVDDAIV